MRWAPMAEPANASSPESPALRALKLLGKWNRVMQEGALLIGGGGCSCCNNADLIPVTALELEVMDFLDGRHGGEGGSSPIGALLRERAGYEPREAGRLPDLLKAIGGAKTGLDDATLTPLMDDVQAAVESLEAIANGQPY